MIHSIVISCDAKIKFFNDDKSVNWTCLQVTWLPLNKRNGRLASNNFLVHARSFDTLKL